MNPHFKYYWEGVGDDNSALAFYGMPIVDLRESLVAGRTILKASDVTASTLVANGYEVPATPCYARWKGQTERKQRCPRCWAVTRGATDYARHISIRHRDPMEVRS